MNNELDTNKLGRKARVKQEYFTTQGTLLEGEIVIIRNMAKSPVTARMELVVTKDDPSDKRAITIPEDYLELISNVEVDDNVDSTSDDRVANNVMRHNYRVLSDEEKAQMKEAKDRGLEFVEFLDKIGNSRELSLAKTKMEEAVMWSVKHITG